MTIKKGKGIRPALCPFFTGDLPNRSHAALNPSALDSAFNPVFPLKFLHATGRVHKFLFTRKKGVALRADFHVDILHRRARLGNVPAGTGDRCRFVLWMNSLFHSSNLSIGTL